MGKTCLCKFDTVEPHFYIVELGWGGGIHCFYCSCMGMWIVGAC